MHHIISYNGKTRSYNTVYGYRLKISEAKEKNIPVYTIEQVNNMAEALKQAYFLWNLSTQAERALNNADNSKPMFSIKIGNGICVWVKFKRDQLASLLIILKPDFEQESCWYEPSVPNVLKWLKENGIEAEYHYGRLD